LGRMSLLNPSLPAAATNSMSASEVAAISSRRACEKLRPPQLFESTRTSAPPVAENAWRACITKSSALMASATLPLPAELRNFTPINCAIQFTPTTPTPSPAAPIVPAMCVP
jgi:hypothetical protein